jgi:hypothetical protein
VADYIFGGLHLLLSLITFFEYCMKIYHGVNG